MRLNFQFIETGKALDSLKIVQIPRVNCFYWSERTKSEYIFIVGVESEFAECDKIVIYIYLFIYLFIYSICTTTHLDIII